MRIVRVVGMLGLMATVLSSPVVAFQTRSPEKIEKRISPHVVLFQEITAAPPLAIQGLRITPARGVRFWSTIGQDIVTNDTPTRGRETTSRASWRHRALGAINADFFAPNGDPLGLKIVGGEIVSETYPDRPAIGFLPNGQVIMGAPSLDADITRPDGVKAQLLGLNRPAKAQGDMVLFTNYYGTTAQSEGAGVVVILDTLTRPLRAGTVATAVVREVREGSSGIIPTTGGVLIGTGAFADFLRPLQLGATLQVRIDFSGDNAERWRQVEEAVAGGPWLVRNGKSVQVEEHDQGGFNRTTFTERRHPRTAIGRTAQGEIIWLTVDGRQSHSQGASLPELAQIMVRYGAVEAINLDGGGSTTLVVRNLIINSPSDGPERPVANMLLVFDDTTRPTLPQQGYRVEPANGTLKVGDTVRFRVFRNGEAISTWNVVWGVSGGIGFVDQWGRFTALRAGRGAIGAFVDGVWHYVPVVVEGTPTPPANGQTGNP